MKVWLACALLVSAPAPACAASIACWYEGGVVVAPAEVAGIAGDYIIDTAAPRTLLHETRAQAAGIAEPTATGEVLMAGQKVRAITATVVDLDARSGALPTPAAGVIGIDVLGGFVVDLQLAPCRLTLTRGRGSSRDPGPPMAPATVFDGAAARSGLVAISTAGGETLVLSDAAAGLSAPDAKAGRVVGLSMLGRARSEVRTEIAPADEIDPRAIGVVGIGLLEASRLRFDFPRRRLKVTR